MSEFSIDLDTSKVRAQLKELKEEYDDDPVYLVTSGTEYHVYLEYGTRDMPPYPTFRPAVNEFKANPEAFLLKNTELDSLDGLNSTQEVVKTVAFALERQIKINATAATSSGRSPGTHPEHPKVQTGTLRSRIQARRIK